MAMQICNKRVTQVTTNLVRQLYKDFPFLTQGNGSIPTGLHSMSSVFNLKSMNVLFFSASLSVRHAHTDIQVPNFDYYRRKGRLDASKSYRESSDATSPYSYLAPLGKRNHAD